MSCAMAIGLSDGDVIPLSARNTVMLSTPRAEIDRRVAAVKASMASGASFTEAVEKLPD